MEKHTPQDDPKASIGEQNLSRLLNESYRPETVSPDFAHRVKSAMIADAAKRSQRAVRPAVARHLKVAFWGLTTAAAAAAIVVAALTTGHTGQTDAQKLPLVVVTPATGPAAGTPPVVAVPTTKPADKTPAVVAVPTPGPADKIPSVVAIPTTKPTDKTPAVAAVPTAGPADTAAPPGWLTARPAGKALPAAAVTVSQTVQTGPGQRRRAAMPDGSTLYVNQNTKLTVEAKRRVNLLAGEVYVEVSPRPAGAADAVFVVATGGRQVSALGTKFAVRQGAEDTNVLVTQGRVAVSGRREPLAAGRELLARKNSIEETPLADAAARLDWARELFEESQAAMVPPSQYEGGALLVKEGDGSEARLSLRRFHVDVHVEDGFARTTIDQTYFNDEDRRLEGTFYFPLPPDASLSRLAMYVDGQLMEGGMAQRDYARSVYESIVRRMQDPALLEWVDGSTFKMRVFPLQARQEKRIILSYTQKLDSFCGQTNYRFPSGHNLGVTGRWSFHARIRNAGGWTWCSPSHVMSSATQGADLLLDASQDNARLDRDVVLQLQEPAAQKTAVDAAGFSSATYQDAGYLMLRYRPVLHVPPQKPLRNWVFIFETPPTATRCWPGAD